MKTCTRARIMERILQSLYNTVCKIIENRVSVVSPQGLKMGVRDTVAEGASMEQLMVTPTPKGSAAVRPSSVIQFLWLTVLV